MFGFSPTIIAWALSGVMLAGLGTGAYIYYKTTKATIEKQRMEIMALTLANAEQEKTILRQKNEARVNERNNSALQVRLQESEEYQDDLLDILHKHDLTNLASKKPGMIEKRINEGTRNVFSDIESTTSDDNQ